MLVLILLDQDADDFHERRKGMRFVFTDFINQTVEQFDKLSVFALGVDASRSLRFDA